MRLDKQIFCLIGVQSKLSIFMKDLKLGFDWFLKCQKRQI
jgi:hypothetical protein